MNEPDLDAVTGAPHDRGAMKAFAVQSNEAQLISEMDDFTEERYRQMLTHLPKSATKILDVGCGTGRGGAALKAVNSSLELTGVDCVPRRIASLDRSVYEEGLCSFSTGLPLRNGSFDAVVGGEFLEHVAPAEIDATLAELFRVLRLRGRLVLTTPNPDYLKNKIRKLSVLSDDSHMTQHYPDSLRHRLRATGFSRIKIYGSGRLTRYVGERIPVLRVYGCYLIAGDKW